MGSWVLQQSSLGYPVGCSQCVVGAPMGSLWVLAVFCGRLLRGLGYRMLRLLCGGAVSGGGCYGCRYRGDGGGGGAGRRRTVGVVVGIGRCEKTEQHINTSPGIVNHDNCMLKGNQNGN